MNEANRYSPPQAPVADFEKPADTAIPRAVENACVLLWLVLAFAVVRTGIKLWMPTFPDYLYSFDSRLVVAAIFMGLAALVTYWFTWKLRARRNWMRWLLTVLTGLGCIFVALDWRTYMFLFSTALASPHEIVSDVIRLVQCLANITAVVMLNIARSRDWFEAPARD